MGAFDMLDLAEGASGDDAVANVVAAAKKAAEAAAAKKAADKEAKKKAAEARGEVWVDDEPEPEEPKPKERKKKGPAGPKGQQKQAPPQQESQQQPQPQQPDGEGDESPRENNARGAGRGRGQAIVGGSGGGFQGGRGNVRVLYDVNGSRIFENAGDRSYNNGNRGNNTVNGSGYGYNNGNRGYNNGYRRYNNGYSNANGGDNQVNNENNGQYQQAYNENNGRYQQDNYGQRQGYRREDGQTRKQYVPKSKPASEAASDADQKSEGKVEEPAAEAPQKEAIAENVDAAPASESEKSAGDVSKDETKKVEGEGGEPKPKKQKNAVQAMATEPQPRRSARLAVLGKDRERDTERVRDKEKERRDRDKEMNRNRDKNKDKEDREREKSRAKEDADLSKGDEGDQKKGADEKRQAEKEKALRLERVVEDQDDMLAANGDDDDEDKHGGEADMLENIEIGEQKQINEAYKKGTDKFNDDPMSKKPMLSHYDDPMEDEGVTLDEGGRCIGEAEKELRKRIEGGSVQKKTDRSSSSSSPMDRFSHKKDNFRSSWIEAVKQKNRLERIVHSLRCELQQEREEKLCLAECQEIFGNALVEFPIILNECRFLEEKIAEYENQKRLEEDLKLRLRESEQKLVEGENLRKKLHNIILELKGNIRVFCRVRPMFSNESGAVSYPKSGENIGRGVELMHKTQAYSFVFDKVFDHASSQEEVFTEISQLVQSALDGYKVCIFAYGQTGSGKTYTMMGDPEVHDQKGLIPRGLEQIFETSQCHISQGWKYKVEASMWEIYNEDICDLLATDCTSLQDGAATKSKKLNILHDDNGDTYVSNLTVVEVSKPDEVSSLLKRAAEARQTAKTLMNDESSRSHCVLTITILGENERTDQQVEGVLNFIDLAGSERADKSGATGERFEELKAINKSLSCLSMVISSIAQKNVHIPYRNSKLTHLLQPYLGGDSKTLMIVNVRPEASHTEESLCSLRFAVGVNSCEVGKPQPRKQKLPQKHKHNKLRRSLSQGSLGM